VTRPGDDAALDEAARISAHLEAIRRALRESISAAARDYPVPLTSPQILVLQVLVDHARQTGTGLSLSDLSRRVGLAHSTVSGIIGRLERRGLLRRTTRPDDRRFIRIELSAPVKEWVEHDLPGARLRPLVAAVGQATGEERAAILNGLATLERLLVQDGPQPGSA
jgi:MarR family transcriptional regulator, organic hydroperoxide resistance regulator